jgi:hypothetical protein
MRDKLLATVSLLVVAIAMTTSGCLSVYSTVEDDGWVEGDDDSQGEISSQEELEDAYEGSQWEDDIGPNEFEEETDDDNGDDKEQIFTCSDGSTVTGDEECPSTGPNPYCDQVGSNYRGVCHDRRDYSESTGLYPCNDGTEKKRWQDCKDATRKDSDNTKTEIKSTIIENAPKLAVQDGPINQAATEPDHNRFSPIGGGVYFPTESVPNPDRLKFGPFGILLPNQADEEFGPSASANTNAADVSNCKLDGSADGIQQKFNPVRHQACGLYTSADKAYYDGFVAGCMQVGNTKLICETVANSNIVVPPAQMQTAPPPQPTQAIQPTAVSR